MGKTVRSEWKNRENKKIKAYVRKAQETPIEFLESIEDDRFDRVEGQFAVDE